MAKPAKRRSGGRARPKARGRRPGLDTEAAGLVVLGLGLVLLAAMYAPPEVSGAVGTMRRPLRGALGWGAHLAPLPLLLLGAMLFLGRRVGGAARVALGLTIVVSAALVGTGLIAPSEAGSLANAVAEPAVLAVGPLVTMLGVLLAASLGLELALGLAPTRLARAGLRGGLRLGGRAARLLATLFGAARDTAGRARRVSGLRSGWEAHRADLAALAGLYPGAAELGPWTAEAEDALAGAGRLSDAGLDRSREDLTARGGHVSSFTADRARDLAAAVAAEDRGAGPTVEEARRRLAEPVKGSNPAARALEGLRRAMLLDAAALADAARREERERAEALKALAGKLRPADLAAELERHNERGAESGELRERAAGLLERAGALPGWTALVGRLENAPDLERANLALELGAALRHGGADALADLAAWETDLRAIEHPEEPALSGTTADEFAASAGPVALAAPPLAAGPSVYEAIFEMEFPGGNAVRGEDLEVAGPATAAFAPPQISRPQAADLGLPAMLRYTVEDGERPSLHASASVPPPARLEVVDLDLGKPQDGEEDEDDLPWSSPAAPLPTPPVAPAAGPPRVATRPADSNVGERLPASDVPAQGGIPIRVPGASFLDPVSVSSLDSSALERDARARARVIDQTLSHFGLAAKVVDFARGPTVTRYEVEPAPGEKISRIAGLANDLARALAVGGVRVEAPVPGKSVIGLEVPNAEREPVTFRAGLESPGYASKKARLPLLLGKSIDGEMVVGDLARMPHLLIAGSTGSGKSVCVNTLVMSLLFRYLPTELRFVMVDPKMVELTPYDGIPHLVRPVVTNPTDAAGVLLGCVAHMERRYKMMSQVGAKNLEQYNVKARLMREAELPYLVIIIDELADLMITSPKEVEAAIMRLAQMARATGMHLVLATQRPSVDILTSLIKVNVPARAAFAVSSGHDSRTILDSAGAERLTGYGDMLYYQPGYVKPSRLQGPYISEGELARVTEFLRRQFFDDDFGELYGTDFDGGETAGPAAQLPLDFSDPLLRQAAEIVIEEGYASVSRLQRRLAVGHARAGKLVDALEAMKIVGPHLGSKAREVLIARDQLPEYFG